MPGFGTDAESAPYQAERARTLYESSRYLDGDQTNASMFWIGYDAPDNLPWDEGWDAAGVVTEAMATDGGERLADTLDGLRASRDGEPAHMTAIGHSYGSTTTGHAAHDHGIPVDDLVFVGSPGRRRRHQQRRRHRRRPRPRLGRRQQPRPDRQPRQPRLDPRRDPRSAPGSATTPPRTTSAPTASRPSRPPARGDASASTPSSDHSKYFDHDTESLYNISQIVNGNYDAVQHADHVYDPWYDGPQDPESDRDPTPPTPTSGP